MPSLMALRITLALAFLYFAVPVLLVTIPADLFGPVVTGAVPKRIHYVGITWDA